ncbi:MAG: biotin/lipoyl-binding protein [Rhizobiales bacterium]|nr:biotin/lipoyl-binding protein [Hyphomicrobiales bacterium]
MKKLIPILIVALAATAFVLRDRWLPAPAGQANYLGYVEGETVLIAAPVAGRIAARPAEKGKKVKQGDVVFSLDTVTASAAVRQAEAAVSAAKSQLDDLLTGKRPPELAVIGAQRAQAEAGLVLARKELSRSQALARTGTATPASLDQAQAAVAQYEAQIAQFDASEAVARLAGRDALIAAARAAVEQAGAGVDQARQRLADLSPAALKDALV